MNRRKDVLSLYSLLDVLFFFFSSFFDLKKYFIVFF